MFIGPLWFEMFSDVIVLYAMRKNRLDIHKMDLCVTTCNIFYINLELTMDFIQRNCWTRPCVLVSSPCKPMRDLSTAHSNVMVLSGLGEHMNSFHICDLPSFQHNIKTYDKLRIQPFVSNVYII